MRLASSWNQSGSVFDANFEACYNGKERSDGRIVCRFTNIGAGSVVRSLKRSGSSLIATSPSAKNAAASSNCCCLPRRSSSKGQVGTSPITPAKALLRRRKKGKRKKQTPRPRERTTKVLSTNQANRQPAILRNLQILRQPQSRQILNLVLVNRGFQFIENGLGATRLLLNFQETHWLTFPAMHQATAEASPVVPDDRHCDPPPAGLRAEPSGRYHVGWGRTSPWTYPPQASPSFSGRREML